MRVSLTKQQALVAKCTTRNDDRPYLSLVRIGDGHIVSTTGWAAASAPVDYDGEPIFVPADMIPSGPCDIEAGDGVVRVITAEGTDEAMMPDASEYPDVDKAWQRVVKRKPKAMVALDVALLRQMLQCIEGCGGGKNGNGIVRLYVRKPSDAVEWRVVMDAGVLVQGLIMPMFVAWDQS